MVGALKKLIGWAAFLAVLFFGLQLAASESGEVVVLRTFAGGEPQETRLWIVDDAGTSWLRAGSPEAGWYQRLKENPQVEVERGGAVYTYEAFPIEGGPPVDHVNAFMLQKYGWADQLIGLVADRSDSVAIRLDPA